VVLAQLVRFSVEVFRVGAALLRLAHQRLDASVHSRMTEASNFLELLLRDLSAISARRPGRDDKIPLLLKHAAKRFSCSRARALPSAFASFARAIFPVLFDLLSTLRPGVFSAVEEWARFLYLLHHVFHQFYHFWLVSALSSSMTFFTEYDKWSARRLRQALANSSAHPWRGSLERLTPAIANRPTPSQ